MAENEPFDLLLRGGRVICPASGLNGVMDVAIRNGRIARYRCSTTAPTITPRPPNNCTARSITRDAASVAPSFAIETSVVARAPVVSLQCAARKTSKRGKTPARLCRRSRQSSSRNRA